MAASLSSQEYLRLSCDVPSTLDADSEIGGPAGNTADGEAALEQRRTVRFSTFLTVISEGEPRVGLIATEDNTGNRDSHKKYPAAQGLEQEVADGIWLYVHALRKLLVYVAIWLLCCNLPFLVTLIVELLHWLHSQAQDSLPHEVHPENDRLGSW
eukprot:CAMPEP_0115670788 /NCGR_PEP_ID=MMETSP0272-20121206/51718_1 /TAXON_ID=71861 /ORGANISM="Scrippsiella trochoidea, Strain CCMP3099" /LENGTH=154 /DNA_ID=CAMNT_0003109541 /DNA_START=62 /DNA_END=526 /DNA_ORIENTATION=-